MMLALMLRLENRVILSFGARGGLDKTRALQFVSVRLLFQAPSSSRIIPFFLCRSNLERQEKFLLCG